MGTEELTVRTSYIVTGENMSREIVIEAGQMERVTDNFPAAKTGELTTRTDNDTGVITAAGGHGIITGNKIDVFWDGGSRRLMDATVAVNAITVDGGTGDNLPALNSDVTLMKPVVKTVDLDGDEAKGIAVWARRGGYIAFLDGEDNDIKVYGPLASNEADGWDGTGTNPLASNVVASVTFSHGYSAASAEMRVRVPYGDPL